MVRRTRIARRKRVFIACEGESEQGYAALLQRLADDAGLFVHIDARVIPRAGDPLALAERAAATLARISNGPKPSFVEKFLQLDIDLIGQNPDRDARMTQVAGYAGLTLIRQKICFEAFLLRHFPGHEDDRPATSVDALNRVRGVWPEYKKGSPAQELAKRLNIDDVRRAARNRLNADFLVLLTVLGLHD